MPWMGWTDRGDAAGVRTGGQPVEEFRTDGPAPLAARGSAISWTRFSGNQQHQPRALRLCQSQSVIEPHVGAVQRITVQVDGEVGLRQPVGQFAVPAGIKGGAVERARFQILPGTRWRTGHWVRRLEGTCSVTYSNWHLPAARRVGTPGYRFHRLRHPRPQRGFFSR